MILKKHPDIMINILKKQNHTENEASFHVHESKQNDYLNEALCKITKSLFFDQKMSYCSNDDVNTFSKKM